MFPRDKIASVETTEIGDRQQINGREQRVYKLYIYTHTYIEREREKMDFYQRDKFNSMGKV